MGTHPIGHMSLVRRLREIANETLDGQRDPLMACMDIVGLGDMPNGVPDDVWDTFVGVSSDLDHYPIGAVRQYWAPEALAIRDPQLADFRERAHGEILTSLRALLECLDREYAAEDVAQPKVRDIVFDEIRQLLPGRDVKLDDHLVNDLRLDSDDLRYWLIPNVQTRCDSFPPREAWTEVGTVEEAIALLVQYAGSDPQASRS